MQPRHSACQGAKWPITPAASDPFHAPVSLGVQGLGSGETGRGRLAIGFNASQEEREYFVNLINSLSGLHLRILKFMAVPLEYLADMKVSPDRIRGGFSSFFPIAIPGVNIEVIKSAFRDLFQYGFIGTDKSIFATMTSGQGLSLLGGRVTELGARFIEFCMVRK